MSKLGQEPVYPFKEVTERLGGIETRWVNHKGMSKRFYAACAAMQGLIISYSENGKVHGGYIPITDYKEIMVQAFDFADELLKQEIETNKE